MALILGLWSLTLEPGKTYSQLTTPAIQITNISYGAEVKGNGRSVVSMKYPDFEDEEEEGDSSDEEEEEEDDEDEDSPVKLPKIITKEAVIAVLKPNMTEQAVLNINLVEDTEVVEFSVTGDNTVYLTGNYVRQEDFDQDPYSDEDDSDDDDDESIDSDLQALIDDEADEDSEEDEEVEGKIEEILEPTKSKKRAAAEEPAVAAGDVSMDSVDTLSKNQKKKLAKKLKSADGSAAPAPVAAAAAPAAPAPAAKKAEEPKKAQKATPQTLPGGLVILDAKKGDGPVAKNGKKVGMRYIGKLDNGKIFDSNTKGSPLTFTLGRGEVISGWDKGIVGMAVGGERKLTIPAAMAYGKKGTQGIPGNSTLHFDVKLISIK